MNLSPHFTLAEMTASQTAARHGLDNTPPPEMVGHLVLLCEQILEPARAALGPLRVTSGYRSPLVNSRVGGSRTSAHCLGYAADVLPVSVSKREFAEWVDASQNFERLAPVPLSIVCFRAVPEELRARAVGSDETLGRHLDEWNEELMNRVNQRGKVYFSHTKVDDKLTLRLAVNNLRTTRDHTKLAWEEVNAVFEEMQEAKRRELSR